MQPEPAAVIAWRYVRSCTSPPANTPGTDVAAEPGLRDDVAVLVEVELTLEERGVRVVTDRDEHAGHGELARRVGLDVAEHARSRADRRP